MKMQTLLKCYIPCKKTKDSEWEIIPVEFQILNSETFESGVRNFKQNFASVLTKLVEQEVYYDFECESNKCRFEKIIIEEIDINVV